MLVDTMDNKYVQIFGSWPFRFSVVHIGRLLFQTQPEECTHSVEDLRQALLTHVNTEHRIEENDDISEKLNFECGDTSEKNFLV
mmetsp:Transcript_11860/g.16566  ORF Transcript_11860/g.16566 Transcript_11860/m.16566 type:complete len:84 (+) Transcript_11860:606-857(+)